MLVIVDYFHAVVLLIGPISIVWAFEFLLRNNSQSTIWTVQWFQYDFIDTCLVISQIFNDFFWKFIKKRISFQFIVLFNIVFTTITFLSCIRFCSLPSVVFEIVNTIQISGLPIVLYIFRRKDPLPFVITKLIWLYLQMLTISYVFDNDIDVQPSSFLFLY